MQDHSGAETLTDGNTAGCVIVLGGINLDIKGTSSGSLLDGTSNPGSLSFSPGGVGRNIAENLAHLGIRTVLLGALGNDSYGDQVLSVTADAGVITSGILRIPDRNSGMYVSLTDSKHQRFIALSDMEIMNSVTPEYVQQQEDTISVCSMLVVDTNIPVESIHLAVQLAENHGVPVLIETVSVRKAEKLAAGGISASYLTPNALEYKALTGQNPNIRQPSGIPWVDTVCVTMGPEGVLIIKHDPAQNRRYTSPDITVVDENGAGDAFTAGFIAGLIYGLDEGGAVEAGIKTAILTLRSPFTVCPELTKEVIFTTREEHNE